MKTTSRKKKQQPVMSIMIDLEQPETPISAFLSLFDPAYEDRCPEAVGSARFVDKAKSDRNR